MKLNTVLLILTVAFGLATWLVHQHRMRRWDNSRDRTFVGLEFHPPEAWQQDSFWEGVERVLVSITVLLAMVTIVTIPD